MGEACPVCGAYLRELAAVIAERDALRAALERERAEAGVDGGRVRLGQCRPPFTGTA